MQEFKNCSTLEIGSLVHNTTLFWKSEMFPPEHTQEEMFCQPLSWEHSQDKPRRSRFTSQSDNNVTCSQALRDKKALLGSAARLVAKIKSKSGGGGFFNIYFKILLSLCKTPMTTEYREDAGRQPSAWSKHVKTQEFRTNKEPWLLLETSFLKSSQEITGRAGLESVTRKEWKRKGGKAFISFCLITGRVGETCEVSDNLCISSRYNVMIWKRNFQCRWSFKNLIWKEFVFSATVNPNKKYSSLLQYLLAAEPKFCK